MKQLSEISADTNSIKAQVLTDAEGDESYIKDVANFGCGGGACRNLIAYVDTHAFYQKHAEEIDEILMEMREQGVMTRIDIDEIHGDLRNYLAWLAYEVRAQEILRDLEDEI